MIYMTKCLSYPPRISVMRLAIVAITISFRRIRKARKSIDFLYLWILNRLLITRSEICKVNRGQVGRPVALFILNFENPCIIWQMVSVTSITLIIIYWIIHFTNFTSMTKIQNLGTHYSSHYLTAFKSTFKNIILWSYKVNKGIFAHLTYNICRL